MAMKYLYFLAGGFLVLSCANPPSRDEVADILRPQLAKHQASREVRLGYLTMDRAGEIEVTGTRFSDEASRPMSKALEALGLLAPAAMRAQGWVGDKDAYFWASALTPSGRRVMQELRQQDELPTASLAAAKAELVEISGLSEPIEGRPPGPQFTARFTYRWSPTELGELVNQHLGVSAALSGQKSGSGLFVRYDDGWRLEDLTLE